MSRTISNLVRITAVRIFLLSAMITAQAQFRAGVQGTISDSSGALVPDAKVVLKDLRNRKDPGNQHQRRRVLSHRRALLRASMNSLLRRLATKRASQKT